MDKRLTAAMMAALAAPAMGGAVVEAIRRPSDDMPGLSDWFGGRSGRTKRRKYPSLERVLGKGFAEPGRDFPGYFWKKDAAGPTWRLYKQSPGTRDVIYDEIHDRSIVYSGWGYVKPTYHPGKVA